MTLPSSDQSLNQGQWISRLRRICIVMFCGFHLCAVTWWTIPNSYSDFIRNQTPNTTIASRLEHGFFEWHHTIENNLLFELFAEYIDAIGAYQYWDFFAPYSPATLHFLTVCQGIGWNPEKQQIDCAGDVLYTSYDGTLEEAMRSHSGSRSRSFRFTENLVRLDSKLHNQFNRYWLDKALQTGSSAALYLIDHQFYLQIDPDEGAITTTRVDKVLSELMISNSFAHD